MRTATSSISRRSAIRRPGLPIGDTATNLKAAIAGETHEYTDMYPAWRRLRATRALPRSLTGSRRSPRPSARTPTAFRRRSTRSEGSSADPANGGSPRACTGPRGARLKGPRMSTTPAAPGANGGQPRGSDPAPDRVAHGGVLRRHGDRTGTRARLRHLATVAAAASTCATPSRRCSMRSMPRPKGSRRGRQAGLLEGRGQLLPVRHVLHDRSVPTYRHIPGTSTFRT